MSSTKDVVRWSTVETDDTVLLVRQLLTGDEVMVWFDEQRKGWTCEQCGEHSADRISKTCVHVAAAARDLPRATALKIADLGRKAPPMVHKAAAKNGAEKAAEESLTAMLGRSADRRAERHRAHDEEHRRLTSQVVVRRVTDEDRRRLEERRQAKARAYAFG